MKVVSICLLMRRDRLLPQLPFPARGWKFWATQRGAEFLPLRGLRGASRIAQLPIAATGTLRACAISQAIEVRHAAANEVPIRSEKLG